MDTKLLSKEQIAVAASLIQAGELVAFPTETVYGLGADATSQAAVEQVYLAKGRPSDNPLIVHISDIETVFRYVDKVSEKALKLMQHFWPGPLTLVFEIKEKSLPLVVTGGLSTAAFRMPNNKLTLALIKESKVPLVGPSANTSGKPSPTSPEHVFHDLQGKISAILDDGLTEVGIESTVVDMTNQTPVILRPGIIMQEELERVVGPVKIDDHLVNLQAAPKAPGMKYQHYSPEARVLMIDWQKENWQEAINWAKQSDLAIAILANQTIIEQYGRQVDRCFTLSDCHDAQQASQHLFAGLRYLDGEELTEKVDLILVESYEEKGVGYAFMNRLKKAANQEYFS